jgi:lipase chaperone LimK
MTFLFFAEDNQLNEVTNINVHVRENFIVNNENKFHIMQELNMKMPVSFLSANS